jgi:putative flippase GtrA
LELGVSEGWLKAMIGGDPVCNLRAMLVASHPAFASQAFWQLVRYAVAGLAVTCFAAAIYTAAATLLGVQPLVANAISALCGVTASYIVHRHWSFAPERDGGEAGMILRFLAGAALAFALNSLWVWLATGLLHLPPIAPVPAMLFVTPFASFLLNRYWVFEVA